jgi:hypothetical protein
MAEQDTVKHRQPRGIPLYVCVAMLFYFVSYIPVHVGLAWAYHLNTPRSVHRVLKVVYWPINKSLKATGHDDEANKVCFRLWRWLPTRAVP